MTLNYADFASHGGSVSKSGGSDVQDVSWWQQPTLYYHTMARQVAVKHSNPSKSRKHRFLKINKSSPWSWKMLMLNFQDTGFKQESLRSYIKKVIYCSMWAIGVGKHCVIFLGGIELEIGAASYAMLAVRNKANGLPCMETAVNVGQHTTTTI